MKPKPVRYWKITFADGSWFPLRASRSVALRCTHRYEGRPHAVELTKSEWAKLEMKAAKMTSGGTR